MRTAVLDEAEADALIASEAFKADWRGLLDRCPWATSFQSPDFCTTWYRIYRRRFDPLLIVARDDAGKLVGLLPLAFDRKKSSLVAAGKHHAEYQAWICSPGDANDFQRDVLRLIPDRIPKARWKLHYLPPGAPLDWLATRDARKLCVRSSHQRPILRFGDGSEIAKSLSKSGNKSRLRQLRKIGAVTFKQIDDPAEFSSLLRHAAAYHDARQLELQGSAPFHNDPLKEPFHRALFAETKLLHVTALMVGSELASFHANVVHRDEVQMGLIAHNPAMERLSPGKLHVLMLAKLLHEQGFKQLDLTPGGEAYKERFANAHDEVHTLSFFGNRAQKWMGLARIQAETLVKRLIKARQLPSERADYLSPAAAACL